MPEESQRTSKQPADEATRFNQKVSEEFRTRPESMNSGGAERFDLQPGAELGNKFVIECPVGRGGTSVIYRATDKVLQRRVAVKVVLPQRYVDKNTLVRFQREARAISRLDHPNIIKVLDFGLSDNGDPYLVMEWLDGQPLSTMIEREQFLPETRMLEISRQIADALTHAHDRQVLHRDLKPSNVFVCWRDEGIQIKLLDFGIAKITDVDQKLTDTGEVFGSPLYMSPEQCVGERLDVRSDLYSFGCCMYEMLAGTPPFMGASVMETLRMHMHEAPFQLTLARSDLAHGPQLQAIVEKALEKIPAQRYQSAMELRNDLSNVASLEVTKRMPVIRKAIPTAQSKATPISKSVRVTLAILVVVLPVMLFAIAFSVVKFILEVETLEHRLENFSFNKLPSAHEYAADLNLYMTQEKSKPVRDWLKLDATGQEDFDRGNLKKAETSFKSALALTEQIPPDRRPAFTIATMDELIDVLQAQGSGALSQLSMQVTRRERYAREHQLASHLDAASINKSIDRWQSTPELDSAELARLRAVALAATDNLAPDKASQPRLAMLKRLDSLVRPNLPNDEDLRLRLDSALGEACFELRDMDDAQMYFNNTFEQLKTDLASHPDAGLIKRARAESAFFLTLTPSKAIALSEAAMQGAREKADDKAYMADALALDASVNAAYGCGRMREVEALIHSHFGYGRENRWKIAFEFDSVKVKADKAMRARQEAESQTAQALAEYNDAIELAIKCDRSDIAARCSYAEHKIYFELMHYASASARKMGREGVTALRSELRFAECALPPYRTNVENQMLLQQSLTDLSAGSLEPLRSQLKVRAEAVAWRRSSGSN